ncbi:MAG: hypothetical protein HWE22_13170 [Flavobacteriales bacterium]|nr:hypothetical protein [Flavobacteriales bacterium]
MALILRVDVDKPYGRKSFPQKIMSKAREDFWFPQVNALGYLKATEEFISYCNENGVQGCFYFRNCTTPNKRITDLLKKGGHKVGFHAENTRTLESFSEELDVFKKETQGLSITSFTKHGSGQEKLGKHHYAPYEEDKYREWATSANINFPFGNAICSSLEDFQINDKFYPKMFWVHKDYRHQDFPTVENALDAAESLDVPVIIHPSNFIADSFVRQEFQKLVTLSNEKSIAWFTPDNS